MFQAALNNVVVKFERKYIKNFTNIMRIAAIQNNTSIEPADCVNIVGEVVSVPKSISYDKREYKGFSQNDIKKGDTVILSHSVIFDFELTSSDDTPVFKNEVYYKTKEYFVADITHIFAVIRDGIVRMQNGYVMLYDFQEPSKIFLPVNVKKGLYCAKSEVMYIGNSKEGVKGIDVAQGDSVFFNPSKVMKHQINGKCFVIATQEQIFGKEYK